MLKNWLKKLPLVASVRNGLERLKANYPDIQRQALEESGFHKTTETAEWKDDSLAIDKIITIRGGVVDFEFKRSDARSKSHHGVHMIKNRNLVVLFFDDAPAEVYRK